MPSTLDASAMLAVIKSEPGQAVVDSALSVPGNHCYAHEANLCEVFYRRVRDVGTDDARAELRYLIETAGIIPFASPDLEFLWEVGQLRALITSQRLAASLADCFCLATARHFGCELLTADHREFEPIQAMGLAQVLFIR